ncbi:DUF5592 family protein [Sporolactobacillus sp. KGMB 08714]|uniref:DUF5592 family protein n=1 Tax=Sporolactobacillus sp. KGMB 08714 TaxID=3064704 RepID=UPI002FBE494E
MNQVFDIPKQIRTSTKLWNIFSIRHFVALFVLMFFIMYTDFIPVSLRIQTYLVVGFFLFFWITPSRANPKKLLYQSLYCCLARDRTVYHPVRFKRQVDDLNLEDTEMERK